MKNFKTLFVAAIALFVNVVAIAQVGQLDSTFGNGGRVFGANVRGFDLKVQSDGKILVGGRTATNSATAGDFVVDRYHTDGTVDTLFGSNGTAIFSSFNADHFFDMDIQADGKIVLAGIKNQQSTAIEYAWMTTRINDDGSPDAAFGTIITDFGQNNHYQIKVIVQSDGKILSCGTLSTPQNQRIVFTRRNPDNSYDTTFANAGTKTLEFYPNTSGSTLNNINDMVLLPDGKIVGAGSAILSSSGNTTLVFRLNSDGSNDSTFSAGNFYRGLFPTGFTMNAYRIVKTPGGGFIVGGETSQGIAFCRLDSNANVDYTFGTNGFPLFDPQTGRMDFNDMVLQPDGEIVFCGLFAPAATGYPYVARININGTPDTVFGAGGFNLYDVPGSMGGDFQSVVIQADGKILATGFSQDSLVAPTFYTVRILNDLVINNIPEKISDEKISLYPNPGSFFVSVSGDFNFTKAMATGIDGRIQPLEIHSGKLNTETLEKGFYILEFINEKGQRKTAKFFRID